MKEWNADNYQLVKRRKNWHAVSKPQSTIYNENLGTRTDFALENLGISPEEMNRKIQTALQLVQTQTLFTRELATLSGGENKSGVDSSASNEPRYSFIR